MTTDQKPAVTLDDVNAVDLTPTPWKTVKQAAARAQMGPKTIYREIRAGRLRAAVIGNRREYRIHESWIDQWLERSAEPREIRRVG